MNEKIEYTEITTLFEKAKADKHILLALKKAAVCAQNYELVAKFRTMEREFFPETPAQLAAKEKGHRSRIALGMCEIKCNDATAWLITEIMEIILADENYSIKHATELKARQEELFKNSSDEN